jgi:tetratricopeptide (TPR) repeat protein
MLNWGQLVDDKGQADVAERTYRQASAGANDLVKAYPEAPGYSWLLADSLGRLGSLLWSRGAQEQAADLYRRSLILRERLTVEYPDWPHHHSELAWFLATCPDPRFRNPTRAVAAARRAVELAPHNGISWTRFGVAQYRAGDWSAALRALDKAVQLRSGGDSVAWLFLAMAHARRQEREQALCWYDQAVRHLENHYLKGEESQRFRSEATALLDP